MALPVPPDGAPPSEWSRYFLSIQAEGSFVPLNVPVVVYKAFTGLTDEFNLGTLVTGYLKQTTVAGVATPATVAAIPYTDITKLVSGTYTPTLTAVANVTASTAYACQYLRVGDMVTVSGKVDVDPTAGVTLTQLGISLPIASNLGSDEQCAGTAYAVVPNYAGAVLGDAANNRAELDYTTVADVANRSFYFTFSYAVA